jgi:hypothetical protein
VETIAWSPTGEFLATGDVAGRLVFSDTKGRPVSASEDAEGISVPWHGVRTASTWQRESPGAVWHFSAIEQRHHWLGIAFALSGARRKQLIDLREFVGGKGDV